MFVSFSQVILFVSLAQAIRKFRVTRNVFFIKIENPPNMKRTEENFVNAWNFFLPKGDHALMMMRP